MKGTQTVELNIKINLDNAAFENRFEVARCLSQVAVEILDTPGAALASGSGSIRDVNGNSVGQWDIDDSTDSQTRKEHNQ
jgi:hypothetical protein